MADRDTSCAFIYARGTRAGWLAVLAALLLAGPLVATDAHAERRNDPLADLDRDQRRIFSAYTRLFCTQFFRYGEDRFVILPNYYRKRENSAGRTLDQAEEEMTEVRTVKAGLTTIEKKFPPPKAEVVAAALILPYMNVGHYGYISSVRVKEIIGPDEMIVGDIVLIPRSELGTSKNEIRQGLIERQEELKHDTFRLLGFPTKDLREGETYTGKGGLHVAVMSTDTDHNFVLVNFDKLERIRTNEFPEALDYVKISPLAFIDMVRDNRETLLSDGDKTSLITIYRRYYNRYRPTRVASAPPTTPEARPRPRPEPEKTDKPKQDEPRGRDYDTTIDRTPDADPTPRPEPREAEPREVEPRPEPREAEPEREKDDWDPDEDTASEGGAFFGIPF